MRFIYFFHTLSLHLYRRAPRPYHLHYFTLHPPLLVCPQIGTPCSFASYSGVSLPKPSNWSKLLWCYIKYFHNRTITHLALFFPTISLSMASVLQLFHDTPFLDRHMLDFILPTISLSNCQCITTFLPYTTSPNDHHIEYAFCSFILAALYLNTDSSHTPCCP